MTDRQTRKVKIRVAKAERSRTNIYLFMQCMQFSSCIHAVDSTIYGMPSCSTLGHVQSGIPCLNQPLFYISCGTHVLLPAGLADVFVRATVTKTLTFIIFARRSSAAPSRSASVHQTSLKFLNSREFRRCNSVSDYRLGPCGRVRRCAAFLLRKYDLFCTCTQRLRGGILSVCFEWE